MDATLRGRRAALLLGFVAACSSGADATSPAPASLDIPGVDSPSEGALDASAQVPRGPSPEFTAARSPGAAPISGGTLLVGADGHTVVAADPERDVLFVGNLDLPPALATIALRPGDEPGRLVEDAAHRVHVALRRGGALVTVDVSKGTVLARRDVCPAPRGVAYDAAADSVIVACATGELVTFDAAGGPATRTLSLGRDLRDVVVGPSELLVTRFRSGEVLHVDAKGTVTRTETLASIEMPVVSGGGLGLKDLGTMTPAVAWRMRARSDGGANVVHQRGRTSLLMTTPGGYGGIMPCGGAIHSAVTVVGGGLTTPTPAIDGVVLPVDFDVAADGSIVVVSAGNAHTPSLPTLVRITAAAQSGNGSPCVGGEQLRPIGQPVAVAFASGNRLVVQSREPAGLSVLQAASSGGAEVAFAPTAAAGSREDTGHAIFHSNSGSSLACASCHPEGGDDGRSWRFPFGARRTPSLRGTLAGTAPFHWSGDEADIAQLSHDVFSGRMGGPELDVTATGALQQWMFAIPAPPAVRVDEAARARGQALFESADVGCASCHTGDKKTNNATVDVGTGGAFQVPSLIGVGWRAPLLHDGCAATMADRFGACATKGHGTTAQLGAAQLADLSTYLDSL